MEYMVLGITDISGESTLKGYEDWIEVLSYSWNISNPVQSSPSNTGRTTGRPNFGELVVTKKLDLSSSELNAKCASAGNLGLITLNLLRQDEAATVKLEYMVYELADALVSSVSIGGSGDIPIETVTFNYSKINWNYKAQKTAMTEQGQKVKGWDLTTNEPADAAGAAAGA